MIFTEHDTTEHVNENDKLMRNKILLRCTMHLGEEACQQTLLQFPTQVVSPPFFCDDQHWSVFFNDDVNDDDKENSYHAFQVCPQRVNVTQIVETLQ